MMTVYGPYVKVTDDEVEPGDVVAVGPKFGGPAHVMFVGGEPSHMWHAVSRCVSQCGMTVWAPYVVKRIYRPTEKFKWLA